MGTIVVTVAGFTNFPAAAPAGWPANLVWPGVVSPNSARTFTLSDADFHSIIVWAANNYNSQLFVPPGPTAVTAVQVFLVWVQGWTTATINAVQQFFTPAPTPPPPIVIT